MYKVDVGLSTGRLFAVGDVNKDLQNDVITVNEDQTQFQVHYFHKDTYRFLPSNSTVTIE